MRLSVGGGARCRNSGRARCARRCSGRASSPRSSAHRVLEPIEPLRAGPAHHLPCPCTERRPTGRCGHAVRRPRSSRRPSRPGERAEPRPAASEALDTFMPGSLRSPVDVGAAAAGPGRARRASAEALRAGAAPAQRIESAEGTAAMTERWLAHRRRAGSCSRSGRHGAALHDVLPGPIWPRASPGGRAARERLRAGWLERCDGKRTAIFFLHQERAEPLVRVDLGAPTSIARVEVVNRRECCQDTCVPLVVEVSNDRRLERGRTQGRKVRRSVRPSSPAEGSVRAAARRSPDQLALERVSVYGE